MVAADQFGWNLALFSKFLLFFFRHSFEMNNNEMVAKRLGFYAKSVKYW